MDLLTPIQALPKPFETREEFAAHWLATDEHTRRFLNLLVDQGWMYSRGHMQNVNYTWHTLHENRFFSDIKPGTYAVGNDDITFRNRKERQQVILVNSTLVAAYDGALYMLRYGVVSEARLRAAIQEIKENPRERSSAYGLRSGRCGICGRSLSNPESINLGIGPECAQKYEWK